jgi:ABC-type branched-subunit amino acid transport system substrate-binding protein
MNLKLSLLLSAGLLASCTTVATKRTELKPVATHNGKKPKGMTGMTAGKPPLPPKPEPVLTQTLPQADQELSVKAQHAEAEGKYLAAIKDYVTLSVNSKSKQDQEAFRLRAVNILENKLQPKELEEVSDDSDYGFLRGHAFYRLGEQALENKDANKAKKYFSAVEEYLPGSDLALRAQDILAQMESIRSVEAKTVGVILPLSGKNAPVAQRALRGIEMGLGLHLAGSGFKLAVMDSEGNPDTARRGVERLVKEDNAIAIIGSLLSKTAPAVAAKAEELEVPSIGLSQRSGLTEAGPHVFRNSLTSAMQIRHLVRVAMEEQGMKKFAVLYPNDQYGVEFTNIFWDEVLARGGQITAIQTYSVKETDFRLPVQRLVGTYFGEARQDEFNVRLKEVKEADKKRSVRNANIENVLPPVTDFDAIFIPDSAKALGQIAAMLAYNDVRNVTLMGTNLWNTPGIAKRAGNFADHLLFVDSYVPQVDTGARSRFLAEYKSLFNEEPSLIEIQAYDSALILRQLIAAGATSRSELTTKLTELNRFPGALGSLNMSVDREIERPLVALTLEKGNIAPVRQK